MAMRYFKNEHAQSRNTTHGHEHAVAEKLTNNNFIETKIEECPLLTKNIIKQWIQTGDDKYLRDVISHIPVGSFIMQPAGSQSFPDFIIRDHNDRFISLECKSVGTGGAPMWNDNLPKQETIYVLSSGKHDSTTLFFGKDVISETVLSNQEDMIAEINQILQKYKVINDACDNFGRGWYTKIRPQNFQQGSSNITDYFLHKDRLQCEKNVLEFAAL